MSNSKRYFQMNYSEDLGKTHIAHICCSIFDKEFIACNEYKLVFVTDPYVREVH